MVIVMVGSKFGMIRSLLILFSFVFLSSLALGCIGVGYTCDRGALEIHLPVDQAKVDSAYEKADVEPYGQSWGVTGNVTVYYTDTRPVLLYVFKNGLRFQIAVKNFTTGIREDGGWNESCVFWEDPGNIDVKDVARKELLKLRDIGAINITDDQINRVLEKAKWGISGNLWILVGGMGGENSTELISVEGVKCGGGGLVGILKDDSYWTRDKAPSYDLIPGYGPVVVLAIVVVALAAILVLKR